MRRIVKLSSIKQVIRLVSRFLLYQNLENRKIYKGVLQIVSSEQLAKAVEKEYKDKPEVVQKVLVQLSTDVQDKPIITTNK